ncbi:uncharacterized protein [Branchiostoma lanceolatum]|uniref:uncharacterized protein n=1 Tax=Branchiostoma lanceolatum TaxID=7740 RepID=UPI003456E639
MTALRRRRGSELLPLLGRPVTAPDTFTETTTFLLDGNFLLSFPSLLHAPKVQEVPKSSLPEIIPIEAFDQNTPREGENLHRKTFPQPSETFRRVQASLPTIYPTTVSVTQGVQNNNTNSNNENNTSRECEEQYSSSTDQETSDFEDKTQKQDSHTPLFPWLSSEGEDTFEPDAGRQVASAGSLIGRSADSDIQSPLPLLLRRRKSYDQLRPKSCLHKRWRMLGDGHKRTHKKIKVNSLLTKLSDVEIHVDEYIFLSCRDVLSTHSDFFKAMFSSGMRESLEGKVTLHGPLASMFKVLYDYMHGEALQLTGDNAQKVFETADFLQMTEAVDLCIDYMQDNLDTKNCLDALQLGEIYTATRIKSVVYSFIDDEFVEKFMKITPFEFDG